MRMLRCLIYAALFGLGVLTLFAGELARRMTGRQDSAGALPVIGLLLLAVAGIAAFYEYAFWQRARVMRARRELESPQNHRDTDPPISGAG